MSAHNELIPMPVLQLANSLSLTFFDSLYLSRSPSLIESNPQLLGRALSTRNPIAATRNDYVFSLLASQGANDIRRDNPSRKRSAAVAALFASSAQLKSGSRTGSKRKADKILGSLGVDADPHLKRDIEAALHESNGQLFIGGDGDDDFAIISRDEDMMYLVDVLDEMETVRARSAAPSLRTTNATGNSFDSSTDDVDDLTWLTAQMEKEYKLFLAFTQAEGDTTAADDDVGGYKYI